MKLQVALDLVEPSLAVDLARRLCDAGAVDIVEAGTPLIKTAGIFIVSALRVSCPNAEIMADLKTMDVGSLEARLAINAGANIVSVLGAAANETISDFIAETRKLNGKSLIDMISVKDPVSRVKELLNAGLRPDYVGLHLGIDVQKGRGLTVEDLVKEAIKIKDEYGLGVAIAGGVDEKMAQRIKGTNIDIVIVGRAITQAPDPVKAAENIRRLLGIH
ncbi:orotidine 5'-phosphate decarboxylase / HUMPS family protein [Vulcanisaeta souniana]|uniref:Orotidine 5'-phosphate decarboxylase n=1 Tax=Vulcanisaeta souniana JCM 11219 TaxID=1293586 RepID=A0A830E430_9CREN|nr:orotidine 5'-phosphate decarboxylase / HUMPS family protein [Vulcanisaeta souniana]BDR91121.1 orotidine 5'-phosphate decarboxylase [Vulcanisaeta souniana JCM 11219]GGI80984.1 orotidine 5'-phosphate decarboxylase [Vulcanisaeta souniana JCM 11219]